MEVSGEVVTLLDSPDLGMSEMVVRVNTGEVKVAKSVDAFPRMIVEDFFPGIGKAVEEEVGSSQH